MDEHAPAPPTPAQRAVQGLRAQDQRQCGRIGIGVDAVDALTQLNNVTKRLRWWSPNLIPGILQTSLYAEAAIRGHSSSLPEEDIAVLAAHRWDANQTFFERMAGNFVHAYFVVGVTAIMQPLHSPEVHLRQLRRLQGLQARFPVRMQLRIIPDEHPAAGTEPFAIHTLDDGAPVGVYETLTGGYYTTRHEDMALLHNTFNDMISGAYPVPETQLIIEEGMQACSERISALSSSSRPTATHRTASLSLVQRDKPSQ